jgi:hypothetical protein
MNESFLRNYKILMTSDKSSQVVFEVDRILFIQKDQQDVFNVRQYLHLYFVANIRMFLQLE